MGLFSNANSNYNKALDHYDKAKSSSDNHIVFLSELQKAAEYLQKDIRDNRGTADALVVLSNIYYAVFLWNREVNIYSNAIDKTKYLIYAVALMQQWRLGWRGYNKNSSQGRIVIDMLNEAIFALFPNITTPEKNKQFWEEAHSQFYEDALLLKIIN